MENLQKGKHYFYSGIEYIVTGTIPMNLENKNEENIGIVYRPASDIEHSILGDAVVDMKTFNRDFIPTQLEKGMEVLAISMGKILGKYKIDEVDDKFAKATPTGTKKEILVLSPNINNDGTIEKIYEIYDCEALSSADFIYYSGYWKNVVRTRTTINIVFLPIIKEAVSRITSLLNTARYVDEKDLQDAISSIRNQLRSAYTKLGI